MKKTNLIFLATIMLSTLFFSCSLVKQQEFAKRKYYDFPQSRQHDLKEISGSCASLPHDKTPAKKDIQNTPLLSYLEARYQKLSGPNDDFYLFRLKS